MGKIQPWVPSDDGIEKMRNRKQINTQLLIIKTASSNPLKGPLSCIATYAMYGDTGEVETVPLSTNQSRGLCGTPVSVPPDTRLERSMETS